MVYGLGNYIYSSVSLMNQSLDEFESKSLAPGAFILPPPPLLGKASSLEEHASSSAPA